MVFAAAPPQEPASDEELSRHLTTVRSQIEQKTFDAPRREDLALEMAETLDRAAQASPSPETRRRRWGQAVEFLDWYLTQDPDPPRAPQIRFQAALYRWAQAQSWTRTGALAPKDPKPRQEAVAALDEAIRRFRTVTGGGDNAILADNLRFRLAEALADRAAFDPPGSAGRQSREAEALDLLKQAPAEPGLMGYWHLLEAHLLRRKGKPAETQRELDAANKSTPPPPESEILEVRVPFLLDQKQYDAATASVAASRLDKPGKALWMVRVRLAQLAGFPAGADRFAIEVDLFRAVDELREGTSPEAREALLELVERSVDPDAKHQPEVWDALALAYATAGDPAKAGAQMVRGAERAAALGRAETASSFRLRAGGFLFQSGKFLEADAILSQVAQGTGPAPLRAKAGMLRCLARGRAVALGLPGASSASYAVALEQQIRDFAADPSTDEARWLLGRLAVASSNRDRARALWSAIAAGSARWLDSRLAMIALDRDELESEQMRLDHRRMEELYARADRFAAESIGQARSDSEKTTLLLARALVVLTPRVGNPAAAREICERVSRLPSAPAHLYRARLLRLVALVELGRYVEAEREAQAHPAWRVPAEMEALFDAVRLLDAGASGAANDLRQRRFGLVLKLMVEPLISADEEITPEEHRELSMRLTRALLFTGSDREARRSLVLWRGTPQATAGDRLLRDLGDTYNRLEAYTLDVDVQKLRLKNNLPGSLPWFDARYALALAYFRDGRLKEAAHLIDSTAILHPDLGGKALHEKFIHLRQRIGVAP
jgi:tetratricopeptide (TPR) repeat protein